MTAPMTREELLAVFEDAYEASMQESNRTEPRIAREVGVLVVTAAMRGVADVPLRDVSDAALRHEVQRRGMI